MKVVIVGGGLAGLTAGYRLKRSGWDVVLLERACQAGGRVTSILTQGYAVDPGATQISTGFVAYLKLCREIGLQDDVVEASNLVTLMREGALYSIDGRRSLNALFSSVLGWRSKLTLVRAAYDYLTLKPRMSSTDASACYRNDTESAKAYAERRLTPEIYSVLVDSLIRAYTLRRADNVSCLEWYSALSALLGKSMLSLKGGVQRLPDALSKFLDTRLDSPVRLIERTSNGVTIEYVDHAGAEQVEQADACVIATRLPEAIAIFPEYQKTAGPLNDILKYNKALCVHLGYRVSTNSRAIGVLVPTIEHDQIALLWCNHNKGIGAAPAGHSLITAYFDAAVADKLWIETDEELARISQEFIEKLYPELRGHRDMLHVSRWPLAIPYSVPGAYAELHRVKTNLNPRDRIQFAGDYFSSTGQNSAVHSGEIAAQNLISTFEGANARGLERSAQKKVDAVF